MEELARGRNKEEKRKGRETILNENSGERESESSRYIVLQLRIHASKPTQSSKQLLSKMWADTTFLSNCKGEIGSTEMRNV
jgi:hypothetical protein